MPANSRWALIQGFKG